MVKLNCPNCHESRWSVRFGRFSKRLNKYVRHRTCEKCGYNGKTIEIELSTYQKENEFLDNVVKAINKYNQKEV